MSSVHCKAGSESAHEDFFTKQARLQAEAKLALAQVLHSYMKLSICSRRDDVICEREEEKEEEK